MAVKPSTQGRGFVHSTLQGLAGMVLALSLVAGCQPAARKASGEGPAGSAAPAAVKQLSASAAKAFLAQHPEALLLDVRNPSEWNDDLGHIEGAKLIPLPELAGRLAEIEDYKNKPVVAVCRVGGRSQGAAELLSRSGFTDVANLEGGMSAWRSAGN